MNPKDRLIAELRAQVTTAHDALDHIKRAAHASRTQTRRIRWIARRAEYGITGQPYSDTAFDLERIPSNESEQMRAKRRATALRSALGEALGELQCIAHTHGMTVNMQATIDRLQVVHTVPNELPKVRDGVET